MANNNPGDSNFARCLIFLVGAYFEKTQSWITPVLPAIIILLFPVNILMVKFYVFLTLYLCCPSQRHHVFMPGNQKLIIAVYREHCCKDKVKHGRMKPDIIMKLISEIVEIKHIILPEARNVFSCLIHDIFTRHWLPRNKTLPGHQASAAAKK